MKKIVFSAVMLFAALTANAQFYASLAGGYAFGVPSSVMGTEEVNGNQSVLFGTYGEGFNTQLRLGYFINKTWGVDLSLGYLHGSDQTVRSIQGVAASLPVIDRNISAKAHARAFGVALSAIYNFTDHFYGRFGILTKIGGKTQLNAHMALTTNTDLPASALSSLRLNGLPATSIVEKGSSVEINYTEDYKGKMPFGTIAALGYKYNLSPKVSVFAEVEYMNIGVVRDYSEVKDFSLQTNVLVKGAPAPVKQSLGMEALNGGSFALPSGQTLYKKSTYVEELPANNTDGSKKLTEKASYSSLGLNFGVTYTF